MSQDQIRSIKNAIAQIIDIASQQIDDLDDETMNALTELLNNANERLQQLQQSEQQNPEPSNEPAPSPGAQLMWILAGQDPSAFAQYLQTYPDPELNALARNPEELRRNIEFLSRMMPKGEQPSSEGIQHAPINSSNIYGFKYDPKTGKLLVKFQEGNVYQYQGVPPQIFDIFQKGAIAAKTNGQNNFGRWWTGKIPSLGASFYELIRQGGYPYKKLS